MGVSWSPPGARESTAFMTWPAQRPSQYAAGPAARRARPATAPPEAANDLPRAAHRSGQAVQERGDEDDEASEKREQHETGDDDPLLGPSAAPGRLLGCEGRRRI